MVEAWADMDALLLEVSAALAFSFVIKKLDEALLVDDCLIWSVFGYIYEPKFKLFSYP